MGSWELEILAISRAPIQWILNIIFLRVHIREMVKHVCTQVFAFHKKRAKLVFLHYFLSLWGMFRLCPVRGERVKEMVTYTQTNSICDNSPRIIGVIPLSLPKRFLPERTWLNRSSPPKPILLKLVLSKETCQDFVLKHFSATVLCKEPFF